MSKLCDDAIHCGCSDRVEELEAKLAKAMETLSYYANHDILFQYDDVSFARDTIAKLKG